MTKSDGPPTFPCPVLLVRLLLLSRKATGGSGLLKLQKVLPSIGQLQRDSHFEPLLLEIPVWMCKNTPKMKATVPATEAAGVRILVAS
jgi:hypothetical protein